MQLVLQACFLINTHQIPPEMFINSDQTGVPLTPSSNYTRAPKGAKDVTNTGYGDKRQITATPTTSAAGEMLPLQVLAAALPCALTCAHASLTHILSVHCAVYLQSSL